MQREESGAGAIIVDAPGFHGSLEELVARANRGDLELTEMSVSTVVDEARNALESPERQGDLRAVADALTLLARLVALKAAAVLPDQDATVIEPEDDQSTDAGTAARRVPPVQGRGRSPSLRGRDRGSPELSRARVHRRDPRRAPAHRP